MLQHLVFVFLVTAQPQSSNRHTIVRKMTDSEPKKAISPTLETNPRENLARWAESLQDAARAYCASHDPKGALGLACTAAFWLAVNGGAVVARPAHADPGPMDPASNPAERIIHIQLQLLYKDFADAAAKLRELAIESIGSVNRDAMRDPVLGLHNATANTIITAMYVLHATFTEADIDEFYIRLDVKLMVTTAYDAHTAEFSKVLGLLNDAGVTLDGFEAYRRFLATLSQFPAFGTHVSSFVQLFPDLTTRTVAGVVAHLRVHLPAVSANSGSNPFAGGTMDITGYLRDGSPYQREATASNPFAGAVRASTAGYTHESSGISDEEYHVAFGPVFTTGVYAGLNRSQLVAALTVQPGRGGRNQYGSLEDPVPGTTGANVSDTTPRGMFYCFKHGHNKTHGWDPRTGNCKEACNFMKDRPNEFSRAMRAAKTCKDVAGGCKYVQKKASVDFVSPLPSLTPSLSLPAPTSRKPQYENPFVSLVDPEPISPPDHPRDINSKPVTSNVPFTPSSTSPVYTKPKRTTKAKIGETLFDVNGKETTWSQVEIQHAIPHPASQLSTVLGTHDDLTAPSIADHEPVTADDMSMLKSDVSNIPPIDFPPLPQAHLLNIRNVADAVFVLNHHRSFGSPTLPTFLQAIRNKWIDVPGLTGKIVSQNPPLSIATAQGHLDLVRKGLRSTRPKKPSPPSPFRSRKGSEVKRGGCVALCAKRPPLTLGFIALVCRELRAPLNLPLPAIFGLEEESGMERDKGSKGYNTRSTVSPPPPPSDCARTRTVPRSEWAATDLTGRFPIKSKDGNEYILVTTFQGYIHLTPQPNKSQEAYVTSFKSIFRFFKSHNHVITNLISDNETSASARAFFSSPNINCTVQYVAPNNHRSNPAERFIRTAKNHIISTLASVHITFPLDLWDRLIPLIELTLNHLQPSHFDSSVSAYHGIYHKPCDFRAHPIHPAGQLCYTHVAPLVRKSWDKHSLRAFYIGPALSSYRCHHVYVASTSAMRISDTLYHYPDPLFHFEDPATPPEPLPASPSRPNPTPDGSDLIGTWFNEPESEGLCEIIGTAPPFLKKKEVGNRNSTSPLLADGYHYMIQYRNAADIVHTTSLTEALDWVTRFPAVDPEITVPPAKPASTSSPPSSLRRSKRNRAAALSAGDGDVGASAGGNTQDSTFAPLPPSLLTCALTALNFSWSTTGTLLASSDHMPARPLLHFSHPTPPHASLPSLHACAPLSEMHPLLAYATDAPTLNLDSRGKPLRFSSALAGPNRADWIHADVVELTKLVFDTGTLKPVHHPSQSPTYYNRVVREKLKGKKIERRVRGTAGGDRITFPCSVSSSTASLTCFKMLLNDIVSSDSNFGSADATDFYLGADLPNPQSIKIYCDTFDSATLLALGFTPFLQTETSGKTFVYCDILKSLYGLAISGLLSQLRLLAQLYSHDFLQTETPCLFRHRTRDITFALVVDDFAIRYKDIADLKYFTACLAELYHIKVHPVCVSFLGFTVVYDRVARTISLSYPSYIPDLLTRLNIPNLRTRKSPCVYVPPVFGSKDPQVTLQDTSSPASKDDLATLQIIIGSILYYARAVDGTMLPAVCLLSSQQSAPTANTMKAAYRLLGYAKLHPNHCLVFKPSDMILRIHSDASYLNRSKSGSTAGGYHYLGTTDPDFFNGPVFCHCTRIPVVCQAVSEAEYAGVFCNGQVGVDERKICQSLGHPQPPTDICCDNECAVGFSEQTMRAKKSKSIDMRFDWIQDRVRQKQFQVVYIKGCLNRADFFTKALPVHVHQELAPLYASPPSSAMLSVRLISPIISDTGATHLLLRKSSLPLLRHMFTKKILPSLNFSLPDGGSLCVSGSHGGVLRFNNKPETVDCYVVPDNKLAHNLFGASPLLRPDGRAVYTTSSVDFFSGSSAVPFLSGTKAPGADLWHLQLPAPISA